MEHQTTCRMFIRLSLETSRLSHQTPKLSHRPYLKMCIIWCCTGCMKAFKISTLTTFPNLHHKVEIRVHVVTSLSQSSLLCCFHARATLNPTPGTAPAAWSSLVSRSSFLTHEDHLPRRFLPWWWSLIKIAWLRLPVSEQRQSHDKQTEERIL